MKKFNIFTVFFAGVTLTAALFSPLAAALDDPAVQTGTALLVERNSGIVLYQKNKDGKIATGGAAKVMTLLLAVEAIENGQASLLDHVTPTETFMEGIGEDDAVLGIRTGETMKLEDLLYGAYISSGNDACNIVAEHLAGDIAVFVSRMNAAALLYGCAGTNFTNPCGLGGPEAYTTAWDQYLIFKEAINHPLFMKIAGAPAYQTAPTDYARERSLKNGNLMLDDESAYHYDTCAAGCLDLSGGDGADFISYADDGQLALISVVYGSIEGSDLPPQEQSISEAWHLLDWGFNSYAWQIVLDENDIVTREAVVLADESGNVELRPDRSLSLLVRTDLTPEDIVTKIVIFAQREGRQLTAPIQEGALLGEISVIIDGMDRGNAGLVAAREVGLNETQYIKNHVTDTFATKWVQICIGSLLLVLIIYMFLVIRDIRRRRRYRRALEETKRKLIEERKRHESLYR